MRLHLKKQFVKKFNNSYNVCKNNINLIIKIILDLDLLSLIISVFNLDLYIPDGSLQFILEMYYEHQDYFKYLYENSFNKKKDMLFKMCLKFLPKPNSIYYINVLCFHNFLLLCLIFVVNIISIIFIFLAKNLIKKNYSIFNCSFFESTILEILWVSLPSMIIFNIALVSFSLLYKSENLENFITPYIINITGHQWYWSYDYLFYLNFQSSTFKFNDLFSFAKFHYFTDPELNYEFDSYLIDVSDFKVKGLKRLLEVDKPVHILQGLPFRFTVTSLDVIHSWALPMLGIKIDACPGRFLTLNTMFLHSGIEYGQCSELCGFKHSAMPIMIIIWKSEIDWFISTLIECAFFHNLKKNGF